MTSTSNANGLSARDASGVGEEGTNCNYFPLPGSKDTTVGNIKHTMLGTGYLNSGSVSNL